MILRFPFSAPSGPPTNIAVASKTNTSVTLTWDKPLCTERNGNVTGYTYSLQIKESSTFIINNMVTPENAILFGDLIPETKYQFIISAQTRVGTGPFASVDVTTLNSGLYSFLLNSAYLLLKED